MISPAYLATLTAALRAEGLDVRGGRAGSVELLADDGEIGLRP